MVGPLPDAGTAQALFVVSLLASAAAIWILPALSVGLLALAALAGLASGLLAPSGLIALAAFGVGCALYGSGRTDFLLWLALAIAGALMFLHLVPGFESLRVIGPVRIGEGAEYEKQIALDKAGAGVLLLALALPAVTRGSGPVRMLHRAGPVILLTAIGVPVAAFLAGVLDLDITPEGVMLWALFNLLTVCLPEEALFRGLLQTRLVQDASGRGLSPHLALVATAAIFGVAHAPGGAALMLASGLAGLGYGYAYWFSGRIEAAIICHFGVNAVHYLVFTYPYPAG